MRKDYHMHPTVVQNPERFANFVKRAKEQGIGEICVTDHMPLSVSAASDRIPQGQVGTYCAQVRELAKRYEGEISVKCGIEIDYHPSVLPEVETVLAQGSFDFILASSHMHIFIKDYERYTCDDFAAAALENSIQAVQTGLFSAVAHPDMYRFVFTNPQRFPLKNGEYDVMRHKETVMELLDAVARRGMYLEINPHLAEARKDLQYLYPQEPIAWWALEKGVRFCYGSDAHKPQSVGACLQELEAHPVYAQALKDWENNE